MAYSLKILSVYPQEITESGHDEIYLKINGENFWPPAEKYRRISRHQTIDIFQSKDHLSGQSTIELWEKDDISSDDLIARIVVEDPKGVFKKERRTQSGDGGTYEIIYELHPQ